LTEAYDSKIDLIDATEVGEIGEVMHLAKSGRLIVKLNAAGITAGIRPGEMLIDSSGRRVGRIAELIGPVTAPYASVIPMTDRTARLAGAKVFSGGSHREERQPRTHRQQRTEKGRRRRN
jgi:RNA-binding protein